MSSKQHPVGATAALELRVNPESDTLGAFKKAMRRHAAGVCVISVGACDNANGMVATAVTSFSMHPPSMLVCVNETASVAASLHEGTPFGITLLGSRDREMVAAFSRKPSGRARFADPRWRLQAGRLPVLAGAPANLACIVERWMGYGSHRAVIGRVEVVELGEADASLIYRDGAYL